MYPSLADWTFALEANTLSRLGTPSLTSSYAKASTRSEMYSGFEAVGCTLPTISHTPWPPASPSTFEALAPMAALTSDLLSPSAAPFAFPQEVKCA